MYGAGGILVWGILRSAFRETDFWASTSMKRGFKLQWSVGIVFEVQKTSANNLSQKSVWHGWGSTKIPMWLKRKKQGKDWWKMQQVRQSVFTCAWAHRPSCKPVKGHEQKNGVSFHFLKDHSGYCMQNKLLEGINEVRTTTRWTLLRVISKPCSSKP